MQSWGPLIFGHADPETVEAVREAALDGTSFGAPTEREVELAAEIVDAVPSVEQVRLVSSGHRGGDVGAAAGARRHAAATRVIKFAGCYHGHADPFLAEAGSGLATLGIPASPGVPHAVTADTIVVDYNDVDAAAAAVERHGEDLAAIFVEPVAGNMGCVPPVPGFLEALRRSATRAGALLVFDEVITGFRVARGGAQERFGVRPGPDDPRQDRRRRPAARGLRRAGRGDVPPRAGRRRLPGRARSPATRSRPPPGSRCCGGCATRRSTRSSSAERRALEAGLAPFGRVQRVGAMLTFFRGVRPRDASSDSSTRRATASSSAGCSSAASTSRRASTSASSRRSRTATTRSTRRSRRSVMLVGG